MKTRKLIYWTIGLIGVAAAAVVVVWRDPEPESALQEVGTSTGAAESPAPAQSDMSNRVGGQAPEGPRQSSPTTADRTESDTAATAPIPIPPNTGQDFSEAYLHAQTFNRPRLQTLARSFRENKVSGEVLKTLSPEEAEEVLLDWLNPLMQDWAVSLLKANGLANDDVQKLESIASASESSLDQLRDTLTELEGFRQLRTTQEYAELGPIVDEIVELWRSGQSARAVITAKNAVAIYVKFRLRLADNFYRSRIKEFFTDERTVPADHIAYHRMLLDLDADALANYAEGYLRPNETGAGKIMPYIEN